MKRIGFWVLLMCAIVFAFAENKDYNYINIYISGAKVYSGPVNDVDSINIASGKLLRLYDRDRNVLYSQLISQLDSIIFSYVDLDSIATHMDYTITKYMNKATGVGSQQGMDICQDQIFVMSDGGTCNVYSYTAKDNVPLGTFKLGSARSGNHCNTANFGVETAEGASFPLFYVSIGKPGDKDEFALFVESITFNDGVYSSSLVQTIRMDQSEFSKNGLQPIWGCPNWVVDKERGYLWAFSAIKRTLVSTTGSMDSNKYVATKYRLPKLSEGKEVIFKVDDVLDQAIMPFDVYITQGGTMRDGKLYYCYGYAASSSTSQTLAQMRIYDTDTRKIVGRFNLYNHITVEPEDISLYNGKLYLNTNSAYLYELVSDFWK